MPTPDTITVDRQYIAGRLTAAHDALSTLLKAIDDAAKHPPTNRLDAAQLAGWQICMARLCDHPACGNAWITLGVLDLFKKQIAGPPAPPLPPQAPPPAPEP